MIVLQSLDLTATVLIKIAVHQQNTKGSNIMQKEATLV